ncbi:hypothetical protein EST38_g12631, partial [Candolleomyces aberdarensis]
KGGQYRMILNLRAITLIDDECRKMSEQRTRDKTDGNKAQITTLKRKRVYSDRDAAQEPAKRAVVDPVTVLYEEGPAAVDGDPAPYDAPRIIEADPALNDGQDTAEHATNAATQTTEGNRVVAADPASESIEYSHQRDDTNDGAKGGGATEIDGRKERDEDGARDEVTERAKDNDIENMDPNEYEGHEEMDVDM